MVQINRIADETEAVPQAIFWRPIDYFTTELRHGMDDLDNHIFATFDLGNWLRFDLRYYDGHPIGTTSLYLPLSLNEDSDIRHATDRAIGELRVPKLAIAWRRGEPVDYGNLSRKAADRLREDEARALVLKIAAVMPNGRAETEELIDRAPDFFVPSPVDLAPSRTRQNQPRWHQIIRNVISHGWGANGLFAMGLANRVPGGLEITDAGRTRLQSLGYLP